MHAGEAADFQRKQNENASRAKYHRTETYSTRQGGILRPRAVRVWSNFSGTVGSGQQVPHRLSGLRAHHHFFCVSCKISWCRCDARVTQRSRFHRRNLSHLREPTERLQLFVDKQVWPVGYQMM